MAEFVNTDGYPAVIPMAIRVKRAVLIRVVDIIAVICNLKCKDLYKNSIVKDEKLTKCDLYLSYNILLSKSFIRSFY